MTRCVRHACALAAARWQPRAGMSDVCWTACERLCGRLRRLVHVAQDAVELNDEGAAALASACQLLQGPTGTALTPEQCSCVNIDFLVSFWLVNTARRLPPLLVLLHTGHTARI